MTFMKISEEDVDLFYEELTGNSADELLLEEKRRIIENVKEIDNRRYNT